MAAGELQYLQPKGIGKIKSKECEFITDKTEGHGKKLDSVTVLNKRRVGALWDSPALIPGLLSDFRLLLPFDWRKEL